MACVGVSEVGESPTLGTLGKCGVNLEGGRGKEEKELKTAMIEGKGRKGTENGRGKGREEGKRKIRKKRKMGNS